jgi:pilus assembly protein CpaC
MMKRLVIFGFLLALGFAPEVRAEGAPVLEVSVDHGVPMTLGGPATSVFIANPDIADVQVMSPTSIMIFGKRTGETSFMATDSGGRTLAQRTIEVTQDLGDLRRELALAIPEAKIQVQSAPNGIVLLGTAKDASTIADAYKLAQRYLPSSGGDIINRVHVSGSNQVMLRVRFAEVERTIDNDLGIDWQNIISTGSFVFGLANGNPVSELPTGSAFNINQTGGIFPRPNNPDLSGVTNNVLGAGYAGSHFNINAMIDALSRDGLITILAEPNLTAMSGETANFLAGGEFPIPIPQGNGAISIEYKQFGVSLEFTPTIIGSDRISIHVKPEVSQLTTSTVQINQISVPGLLTRKAETTVEVASGQSFAIAGLLDNTQNQTVDKFPLLGDMPILGALFRDSRFINGQTELVVIITPYVVTPSGEQLALPTDGLSPPSELDRFVKLRYSSSNPNTRPQSGQPTAIKIEPPQASAMIPPVPDDASIPVMPASSIGMPGDATTSPVIHMPAQAKPTSLAPAGPSGFSLE